MKKLIIFPFAILLLASCKKDEDKTCNLNSAAVAGSYKITAVKYKPDASSPETDYYNQFFPDACERDDIITLNANGTYNFVDAGVKCVPPGDDTGTWSLSGNTLTVDGGQSNVDNFNCSTMTLSSSDVFNASDKLTLVLTRQ
ncbi:MAG: lipocalin family protein [Sphingobacteriales bacterium]|nr:lipocalin family protein [Sphingobacteriales bacterium]